MHVLKAISGIKETRDSQYLDISIYQSDLQTWDAWNLEFVFRYVKVKFKIKNPIFCFQKSLEFHQVKTVS